VLSKDQLPKQVATERTLARKAVPEDLRHIACWPAYPWPYDVFNMTDPLAQHPDGRYWWSKIDDPDRCQYSVLLADAGEIIGLLALSRIDWAERVIGNMGVRIRADLCGQGYGTEMLGALLSAVLSAGAVKVRLDVAATNARAIRCYERCGMRKADEFWQPHSGEAIAPADPRWSFAMPHLRQEKGKWLVRFYWMEICRA
jgi:RimJ/RimL family protein N-acetyltransferase